MPALAEILAKPLAEVLKSPDLRGFLQRYYSKDAAQGRAVRGCDSAIGDYYRYYKTRNLLKNFTDMPDTQTFVAKFTLRYVGGAEGHVTPKRLTDAVALRLLAEGRLKPSDFAKLPDGYEAPKRKYKKLEVTENE